jgi:hypothetical protein
MDRPIVIEAQAWWKPSISIEPVPVDTTQKEEESMNRSTLRCGIAAVALSALVFGAQAAGTKAQADTPDARHAAAHEMMRAATALFDPQKMVQSMMGSMTAQITQATRQKNPQLTDVQVQRVAQVMNQAIGESTSDLLNEMIPEMYAQMEQVFADHFTLAEIKQLQGIYTSPVFRKGTEVMMTEMPQLMKPMMARMQQMQPKIEQRVEAAKQQLKAEGIELK